MLFALFLSSSCSDDGSPSESGTAGVDTFGEEMQVLSIAITLPNTNDYDHAFRLAHAAGMKTPGEITFYWDEVEERDSNGNISYSMPFLPVIKRYLNEFQMKPVITICPIETMESRVPQDLRALPFDDPKMQERFGGLIRWVYDETKDMQPLAVVIGNEFDVHLAQDQKKWGEFKNLYFSSYDLIHSLRGWEGVPVAIEPTFANLVGPNRQVLQDMNRKSDIIGVSYYPLKEGQVEPLLAIKRDMDMLITLYPNKRIDFYQYGYPSSEFLGSSEEKQRAFIEETFEQWDRRKDKIRIITFTWLYDMDIEQVIENAVRTTGMEPDKSLTEFLGTLGLLRRNPGEEKPAFAELLKQARQRKWINQRRGVQGKGN